MKPIKIASLLTIFALIATFTPVKAAPPEIKTYYEHEFGDIECDGYQVRYEWEGTNTFIIHWDKGFINIHNDFKDTFYRTDGLGERYTHVEQNSFKYYQQKGAIEGHGLFWHMVIPGSGSVMISAGHYYFWQDQFLFDRGNDNKNNVMPDSICEAFAL